MAYLVPGDTIGVVAPSGAVSPPHLDAGVTALAALGYKVKLAAHVREIWSYKEYDYAGTPAQRAADIHAMFEDPDVKLVIAARGGYGSDDVIPLLDASRLRAASKPLLGYSDVTYLLNWMSNQAGIPALHGPMVAKDFAFTGGIDLPSFAAAIANDAVWRVDAEQGMEQIYAGCARGALAGGCLSVLVRSMHTHSHSSLTAHHLHILEADEPLILFLEDIGEGPEGIRENWSALKSAGRTKNVQGVVFGYMMEKHRDAAKLRDALAHLFKDEGIPVAFGLRSGHVTADPSLNATEIQANVTLPFGAHAELICKENAIMQLYPLPGAR